ncbi:hypothetical protein ACFE04_014180 [Oxalis oulophora]
MKKHQRDATGLYMVTVIVAFFTLTDARHTKIPESPIRKLMAMSRQPNVDDHHPLDIQSYGELYADALAPQTSPPLWDFLPVLSPSPNAPSPQLAPSDSPLQGPFPSPIPNHLPSPPPPPGLMSPPFKPVLSPPKLPDVLPPPAPVAASPPPHKWPMFAVWCVAKPTVPDPIVQQAMDYACGSGADCKSIQLNGPCFQPNTMFAHASYAFNSYWQTKKAGGGTCDFGGTAMLVTTDPSSNDCQFMYT